jgi:hypothetical protein
MPKVFNAFLMYCNNMAEANDTDPGSEAEAFWKEWYEDIEVERNHIMLNPKEFVLDVAASIDENDGPEDACMMRKFESVKQFIPIHCNYNQGMNGFEISLFFKTTDRYFMPKFYIVYRIKDYGTMWQPPDGEEFIEQGVSIKWLVQNQKIEPIKLQGEKYAREHVFWWFNDELWKSVDDEWAIKMITNEEGEL